MPHYTKAELTTGYCECCNTQVNDLVIAHDTCVTCLELVNPNDTEGNDEDE